MKFLRFEYHRQEHLIIIIFQTFQNIKHSLTLRKTGVVLQTSIGEIIKPEAVVCVKRSLRNQYILIAPSN